MKDDNCECKGSYRCNWCKIREELKRLETENRKLRKHSKCDHFCPVCSHDEGC